MKFQYPIHSALYSNQVSNTWFTFDITTKWISQSDFLLLIQKDEFPHIIHSFIIQIKLIPTTDLLFIIPIKWISTSYSYYFSIKFHI